MSEVIKTQLESGVARIWLNRPERHNALDEILIHDLHKAIDRFTDDAAVRAIVIGAEGPSFCAGADPEWTRRVMQLDAADSFSDACQFAALLLAIACSRKPVIARVQGQAFGGGVGLIAACDIAIGASSAQFALTEVRCGLAAATVSPYVLAALGARQTRRLMLTGERFNAAEAHIFGLLHTVVPADGLDAEVGRQVSLLKLGGPHALAQVKDLVQSFDGEPWSRELAEESARRLVELRVSREGREGVDALLGKRLPDWVVGKGE